MGARSISGFVRTVVRWLIVNGETRLAEVVVTAAESNPCNRHLLPGVAGTAERITHRPAGPGWRQLTGQDLAELSIKLELELKQLHAMIEKITGPRGSVRSE
jgi:hypothetical protein